MRKILVLAITGLLLLTGCTSNKTPQNGEKQLTATKGKLTIGMECNYAPFNWTQLDKNDTAVPISSVDYCDGYDVAVARKIAEEMGMELVIKKTAWDGLEPAVNSNEIDAIIAGMTKTPERAENVDFTEPYYESEMVMVVRKSDALAQASSIQDFSGKIVLGQLNTLYDEVIDQITNVNHHTPLATYPLMVVALQNKEVDAITAELPVATGVVAANPDLAIVQFGEGKGFEADTTVSIAVRKGNTELLNAIQNALSKITEEQRQTMMQDATDRQPAVN